MSKNLNKRGVLAACAALGAALLFTTGCTGSASPDSSGEAASEAVSIAVYNNGAPATFIEDGELTGWMIEVLEELEPETGLKFELQQVKDFSTIIPGLQSHRFDLAASNITVTNERKEVVDFVTTNVNGTAFATLTDGGAAIDEALDTCGLTIAALSGSVYVDQMGGINAECEAAGKAAPVADLYPDSAAAILAVQNGRADAYMDSYSLLGYGATASGKLTVQSYQFAQLPEALAFPKDSPYTQIFLDAMNKVIENGTYAAILEKHNLAGLAITESVLNPEVD